MTTPIPPDPNVPPNPTAPGQPPVNPLPRKPNSSLPAWLLIAIIAFLVIVMGCCGGITTCSYFARKAARTAVEKVKEAAAQSTQVPVNFPNDIPLASDLTVVNSLATNAGDSGLLNLTSTASVDSLASYYRTQMPANGWTTDNDKSFGDKVVEAFTKGDRHASIIISKDDQHTSVMITYSAH